MKSKYQDLFFKYYYSELMKNVFHVHFIKQMFLTKNTK